MLMAARILLATTMNLDGLSSLWLRNVTTYVLAIAAGKIARKRKEHKSGLYSTVASSMAPVRSSNRKPFQSVRPALDQVEFYRELCSPSYCSAPQTWQTAAPRLMRDRHRRQILNRLRHHKKEDVSAAKTRRMTFGSIASRLFPARPQHKSLSGINDEQRRSA